MQIRGDKHGGGEITSLESWRKYGQPASALHWVPGRSAMELAAAWCGTGGPAVPPEVANFLEPIIPQAAWDGDGVEGVAEITAPFDDHGRGLGAGANLDLMLSVPTGGGEVVVGVEAKADERFGELTVRQKHRSSDNPRSAIPDRVEGLLRAVLPPADSPVKTYGELRYQLLTAAAGTAAFAERTGAAAAVLLVHQFDNSEASNCSPQRRNKPAKVEENRHDLEQFLRAIGLKPDVARGGDFLLGPVRLPGYGDIDFYVAKLVTSLD